MKSKVFILILNAVYLIATIVWCIIEHDSFEPVVAIIGGLVSLTTYCVAYDKPFSFSVNVSNPRVETAGGDIKKGREINMGPRSTYHENNNK
jgi:hypothetical protein